MRRILLSLLAIVFLSIAVFCQDKPASIKLFQFDQKTESPDAFVEKAKSLFDRLKVEKESGPFISVSKNSDLAAKLKNLKGFSELKSRITFFAPPIFYDSELDSVDFWLIPLGSEPPFRTGCGGCNCPSIEVSGDTLTEPLTVETTLGFSAKLSGADIDLVPLFKWKVTGADIIKGGVSAEIKVKPHFPFEKEITATVELGGLDPSCNCPNTASQTIRLAP